MKPLRAGDRTQVGAYQILARLGEGGMGQVFLGASPGGRKVAVKLMLPEHAADQGFRRRFAREVAAARQVGGFHTALVVDADPDADPPWMVTAYIPGPSLAAEVAEHGPLDPGAITRLGAALAEGLAAIHACGLVHRDLKPANIIMADDGPRIIDFGIVRGTEVSAITSTGTIIGTYQYMSPEQIRAGEVTAQSDVFSLGGVLTFAATGRAPFDAPAIPAIISRILTDPPDLGQITGPLHGIIAACLSKNPADRPSPALLLSRFSTQPPAPEPQPTVKPRSSGIEHPDQFRQATRTQRPSDPISVRRSLEGHTAEITLVQFSPDGGLLATADRDMIVRLWDAATGQPVGSPISVPAAPGYKASQSTQIRRMIFSPDSRTLLVPCWGPALSMWDTATGQPARPPVQVPLNNEWIRDFSPDGRFFVTKAKNTSTLALWDLGTFPHLRGKPVEPDATAGNEDNVAFSRDSRFFMAIGDQERVLIWETATGRLVQDTGAKPGLTGPRVGRYWKTHKAALSPDGQILAILGEGVISFPTVRLWNVPAGKLVGRPIETHAVDNSAMVFSPDGRLLVVFALDKEKDRNRDIMRILDIAHREHVDLPWLIRTEDPEITTENHFPKIIFSPDGQLLAWGRDSHVRLWDVAARRELEPHPYCARERFRDAAFSPDSHLLATASGTTADLWKIPSRP